MWAQDNCAMSIQADDTEATDTSNEEDDVIVRYKEQNIMFSTNMPICCSCIKMNANVLLTVDASTAHVA
jgi:hypothetical protein